MHPMHPSPLTIPLTAILSDLARRASHEGPKLPEPRFATRRATALARLDDAIERAAEAPSSEAAFEALAMAAATVAASLQVERLASEPAWRAEFREAMKDPEEPRIEIRVAAEHAAEARAALASAEGATYSAPPAAARDEVIVELPDGPAVEVELPVARGRPSDEDMAAARARVEALAERFNTAMASAASVTKP